MKLKAIFKGTSSLGYVKGALYDIVLRGEGTRAVSIKKADGTGFCLYGNFHKFLENWNHINHA